MITVDQIILHAIGDYILQSDWMANEKTKSHVVAATHAFVYSIPFTLLAPSFTAWCVIFCTHELIDRYRLARYVVWFKNWMGPNRSWSECSSTGFPPDRPVWLAVWLMIFVDNIIHILINGMALRYL